ncbi:MAG: Rho termination factor N-terminal domain-containing protein [Aeromonas jandaei]
MQNKSVKELKEIAKSLGIKGYSSMTKPELLSALGVKVEEEIQDFIDEKTANVSDAAAPKLVEKIETAEKEIVENTTKMKEEAKEKEVITTEEMDKAKAKKAGSQNKYFVFGPELPETGVEVNTKELTAISIKFNGPKHMMGITRQLKMSEPGTKVPLGKTGYVVALEHSRTAEVTTRTKVEETAPVTENNTTDGEATK